MLGITIKQSTLSSQLIVVLNLIRDILLGNLIHLVRTDLAFICFNLTNLYVALK
jgi:hypothetical protein